MKTRPLIEAEQIALISCELGARLSQEASGIHYYLRRARNDLTNTVLANSCAERLKHAVGTASLEGQAAAAALVVEDVGVGGIHDAGMSAGVVAAVLVDGAGIAGTAGTAASAVALGTEKVR
jgi:hypothetical protein